MRTASLFLATWVLITVAASGNVLQNPGFETGAGGGGAPDQWWVYDECGQETWAARNGGYGVAFRAWNQDAWGGIGQNVSIHPESGDILTFSVWGLAEENYSSSLNEAWIKVTVWTNGATNATASFSRDVYGDLVAALGAWNRYTLVVTNYLDDVDHVEVVVGGGGFASGSSQGSVLWDDAELTVSADNLLLSPGFETGSDWMLGGDLAYESWAARSGTQGAAMYGWMYGGYAYQDIAAHGSSNYTFRLYGLKDAAYDLASQTTELKLEFYSDAGLTVVGVVTEVVTSAEASWSAYEVSGVSPEETRLVRVTLAFGGTPTGDSFKWDDARLRSTAIPSGFHVASSVGSNQSFRLSWQGDTNRYYQVWASDALDGSWEQVRGMALGEEVEQLWLDDMAVADYTSLYYRITALWVDDPDDADIDGLDDVTELRAGNLDPTDPDSDDDGIDDGIDPRPATPNEAPDVEDMSLSSTANYHNDTAVGLTVAGSDPDGDDVMYRYRANGNALSPWQSSNQFSWTPPTNASGSQTLTVEARDAWGALSSDSTSLYLFQTPPRP